MYDSLQTIGTQFARINDFPEIQKMCFENIAIGDKV